MQGAAMSHICFCCLQTGMPMPALSVLGASWRLKASERSLLVGTYMPWALHAGSRSADLMCLYYERHFEVCHSAAACQERGSSAMQHTSCLCKRDRLRNLPGVILCNMP